MDWFKIGSNTYRALPADREGRYKIMCVRIDGLESGRFGKFQGQYSTKDVKGFLERHLNTPPSNICPFLRRSHA